MAKYQRFEDLPVWQSSRELARFVFEITTRESFRKAFSLRDQLQKSAVSVVSNIAEGFERGSKAEHIQFLYVARGSCGELRAQLYVAFDVGCVNDKDFANAHAMARDVSRQINGFIEYLKTAPQSGQKLKKC